MPRTATCRLAAGRGTAEVPLWLGHWTASRDPLPALPGAMATRAFRLDTCMRRVVLTAEQRVGAQLAALQPAELFSGTDAYRFLLEVSAGLRSAVPGETNVFGQLKRAWEAHRQAGERDGVRSLAPVIAQVIRDTRRVRQLHLQNLGGASYGSLVRRLLAPDSGERVLFVGAGELARSMLPFFRAVQTGVWNRSAPGAAFAAAGRVFSPEDGAAAAGWADHVIMTTPPDALNDARWSGWLAGSLARSVVHLGQRGGSDWGCPLHVAGYDLDDVFDLRQSQDNIRSLQLQRARLACRELAAAFAGGSRLRA